MKTPVEQVSEMRQVRNSPEKIKTTQSKNFFSHDEAIKKAVAMCQELYHACGRNEHEVSRLITILERSGDHVRAGQFNVSVDGAKVYVYVSGNPNDVESGKLITEAWKKI